MSNLPSLPEFWDLCASHDWWYQYADDGRAYRAGAAENADLANIAHRGGEAYVKILSSWRAHVFDPAKTAPKPVRPEVSPGANRLASIELAQDPNLATLSTLTVRFTSGQYFRVNTPTDCDPRIFLVTLEALKNLIERDLRAGDLA